MPHARRVLLLLPLLLVVACDGDPTVVDSPPSVTIVSPSPGETRVDGESFTFDANASDDEDGDLATSVAWRSDIDGALGTGTPVTAVLTTGEHTVTARVTDSETQAGSASVTVQVVPILQADASCESEAGAAVVSFTDPALESAVRDELGVAPGDYLTCQAVGSLTSLAAPGAGIVDLTGIQNLVGLDTLDLDRNQVVQLRWLSDLSGLLRLSLASNGITDVGPLSSLEALTELDLRDNEGVDDLTPLMSHPGLGSGDMVKVEGTASRCVEVALVAAGGSTVTSDCPALVPAIVFSVISPDGRDIYSMKLDGTDVTRLTTTPGDDDAPQWSPDGSSIVFTSERDGDIEIYSMNADGSNQTRLSNHVWDDRYPTWSPDGSQIAFERAGNLVTMDADGSNQATIATGLGAPGRPDWSPDGSRLVATAHSGVSFDVYTVDLTTANTTNLTSNDLPEGHPAWSPDGMSIVFSRNVGGDQVWVMDADGSNATKLADVGSDNLHPDWSPDGDWIVFMSNRTGNGQIFATKPDGSVVVEIGGTDIGDVDPSWR